MPERPPRPPHCSRGVRTAAALALVALSVTAALNTPAAAPDAASAADRPSSTGSGNSYAPVFSADGRFIAFVSQAHNLVTNDAPGPFLNVFVRDLAASNTVLVSVNTNGFGGGNDNANFPSLSSNGQLIAFESAASNLAPNDTNGSANIFVRDMANGRTYLMSRGTNGFPANGPSTAPLLTADGQWVIFESAAENLVTNDSNGVADIFARMVFSTRLERVSANATNAGPAVGPCESPAITPDGRFVAFVKSCTNWIPCGGLAESRGEIYVRDRESGTLHWASAGVCTNFQSYGYEYRCLNPALSDDDRYVVFQATSDLGGPTYLFRRDLALGETTRLDPLSVTNTSWPAVSAAGDRVAYEGSGGLRLWEESTQSSRLIFPVASPVRCLSPAITPDGSRIVFLVASNTTALLYVQDVATGSNRVAGLTTNGLPATVNEVTAPELSGDGRQVAFETLDHRLVEDDFNLAADIFVYDLDANTTQLVSRRAAGRPPRTLAPMSTAVPGGLSANGRFAAFLTYDTQQGEDTNDWQNIVVRDLLTGASQFIGLGTNGTREPALSADGRYVAYNGGPWERVSWSDYSRQSVWRWDRQTGSNDAVAVVANKSARAPAISHDGNLVAFHTTATPTDLGLTSLGDGNSGTDVFLRDMSRATHWLISVNRLGTATGNGLSECPVFSPNGRWLVFRSAATDLTTNGLPGLFARDLWSNTTVPVGFPSSGLPLSGQPTGVVFSADSRFVAFAQTNLVGLYDLHARTGSIACANGRAPSLSADGRLLACELLPDPLVPTPPPAYRQILIKDLRTGATNLASVSFTNSASGGNGHSDAPFLSYDGRFVVFTSKASNLVPDDTNGVSDVFVRDLRLGTTLLVSRNLAGSGSGDASSGRAIMAADGRTVLFQSFARDLVDGDFNDRRDVFVLRLGGPDTDGDGMEDDWEVAYFGDLSHDGVADTDHDGLTDLLEFVTGTDPTNSGSIFRAITVTSLGSGAKTILWNATPGRTYIMQYKDTLDDSQWTNLPPGPVTVAGTTGSAVDALAGATPQRFYRVVLVP